MSVMMPRRSILFARCGRQWSLSVPVEVDGSTAAVGRRVAGTTAVPAADAATAAGRTRTFASMRTASRAGSLASLDPRSTAAGL